MNKLVFSEKFEKSFSKIKDNKIKKQIWGKILQLEKRSPIGKKLKGNPCWAIHVGRFRVIYEIKDFKIKIINVLERKHSYK